MSESHGAPKAEIFARFNATAHLLTDCYNCKSKNVYETILPCTTATAGPPPPRTFLVICRDCGANVTRA